MTQPFEYSLLAAASYDDIRGQIQNRAPVPTGWAEVTQYAMSGSGSNSSFATTGFSAKVFKNTTTGEVVISFAGTEFGKTGTGLLLDFAGGNIPLAVGAASPQAAAAADLYQRVKADASLSDNITFTGHSLGGGIASVMAVWFDRPAYVFAPAPFESAATATGLTSAIATTKLALISNSGGIDPSFASYVPVSDFVAREAQVHAWAIKGEVLEATLGAFNWVEAAVRVNLYKHAPWDSNWKGIDVGWVLTKHSIDLHAAALVTPNFETQADKLTGLLPMLFDASFYGAPVTGGEINVLLKLLRNEVGVIGIAPNGMLTHFAADLQKLATNLQGLNKAAQDAITSQAIEWYYWQGNAYSGQEFFRVNGALLQYTTAQGAGLLLNSGRTGRYITPWLAEQFAANGGAGGLPYFGTEFAQWSVSTGLAVLAGALTSGQRQIFVGQGGGDIFAGGLVQDLLLGGAGNDSLSGGGGADNLLGGSGNDSLEGGLGDDQLNGGVDTDTYIFKAGWGADTVRDSDGLGVLQVDGFASGLPQGRRIGVGLYQSADGKVTYTLAKISEIRTDLTISFKGIADQITIQSWTGGQFGISFDETPVPPANLTLGDTKPNVNDSLVGTAGTDSLVGLTGNDALSGGDGNDVLEGGLGSDVLAGGLGADVLNGGDGTDYIFGSANAGAAAWSDVRGEWIVLGGASWTIPGVGTPAAGDQGNVIDGGAGADWVAAGTGNDLVRGGVGGDIVYGMAGSDYIDGGDDADDLHGDSTNIAINNYNTTQATENGNDTLVGGLGNDTLYGEGGLDELYGGADDDLLLGDTSSLNLPVSYHGDDYLDGGDGNDTLYGQGGADELFGGIGNDVMSGDDLSSNLVGANHGADYLDGEDGADQLQGDGGADTLFGGIGNDTVIGDTASDDPLQQLAAQFHGNDYLDGEDGNDILYGTGGADSLFGGIGNDHLLGDDNVSRLAASAHGNDYLDGEDGDDILEGGGGADTLYGGLGLDSLWGDSDVSAADQAAFGADYLDGEDGNDYLEGGGGADTLIGGTGADVLFGDSNQPSATPSAPTDGKDDLDGGDGNDQLLGGGADDRLLGGAGDDVIYGDDIATVVAASNHGRDTLDGGTGNDQLFGQGGADILSGGDGNDWLSGEDQVNLTAVSTLSGDDNLYGGAGDDTLLGGNGKDLLDGGIGSDYLFGGAGNDSVIGGDGGDWLAGEDQQLSNGVSALIGDDTLVGGAGIDTIIGGNGADRLLGESDTDWLFGGAGADVLIGGSGDDNLYGGDGNDFLSGGEGIDNLQGGAGDDVYDFSLNDMLLGPGGVADSVVDTEGINTLQLAGTLDGVTLTTVGSVGNVAIVTDAQHAVVVQGATAGAVSAVEFAGSGKLVSMDRLLGERLQQQVTLAVNTVGAAAYGGALADTLSSGTLGSGAILSGGRGNDQVTLGSLHGGTVLFSLGDGRDALVTNFALGTSRDAANVLRLGPGITLADLKLSALGAGSFLLEVGAGGDGVTFTMDQTNPKGSSRPFDLIQISGGTQQLTWEQLVDSITGVSTGTLGYTLVGTARNDTISGGEATDTTYGFTNLDAGDDVLRGEGGNDALYEGKGNDVVSGGTGNDTLVGGDGENILLGDAGNDSLYGEYGNNAADYLDGGTGDDLLQGGTASDTYYFARGSGHDLIVDQSTFGSDTIIFGPGIAASDIVVTRSGNDLLLTISGGSDTLQISGVFQWRYSQIEHLQFDDGTLLTYAELVTRIVSNPTGGNDTIYALGGTQEYSGLGGNDLLLGGKSNDLLNGADGADAIEANAGNDTLIGGKGNDQLKGESGSDVYIFSRGDGVDTIFDGKGKIDGSASAELDEIRLGFSPSECQLTQGGYNNSSLYIDFPASGDQIEVWGWFDAENNSALFLTFADGTVWNAQYLRDHAARTPGSLYQYGGPTNDLLNGTASGDTIYGGAGNDTLNGGAGNDSINGGVGDDVYVFGYGYGNDSIDEGTQTRGSGGFDTIRMDSSVQPGNVLISRPDSSRTIISLVNSTDQITIYHYYDSIGPIERIEFASGVVWDIVSNPAGPIALSSANDNFTGTWFNDTIDGGAGNDYLSGGGGHDVIYGGLGNDTLTGADTVDGGAGDDVLSRATHYVFGRGYGHDQIGWGSLLGGLVEFKPGIAPGDLRLTVVAATRNLRVEVLGTADTLEVVQWLPTSTGWAAPAFVFADGTQWTYSDIDLRVDRAGTTGADYLYSRIGVGTNLEGADGNDVIQGDSGNDTIHGGAGNDQLWGGKGVDSYLFNRGDGQDTIDDQQTNTGLDDPIPGASAGKIIFGEGILPEDIVVSGGSRDNSNNAYDLYLSVRNSSDVVTLYRWLAGFEDTTARVDAVEFADGTVWRSDQLLAKYYEFNSGGLMFGSEFNDILRGAAQADRIDGRGGDNRLEGMAGDDTLLGAEGADTLDGGSGNDWLGGGLGNDTYVFARGYGHDVIGDYDRINGGSDRVVMGADIAPGDIIVSRSETDIILSIRGTSDRLGIRWYANPGFAIESIVFQNGVTWTAAQLQQMAIDASAVFGTTASDVLNGDGGSNYLLALDGNDTLNGLAGSDSLDGGGGDDLLDGGLGADVMMGGIGNDSYLVDNLGDRVIEGVGAGTDTVTSTISWSLLENIENLTLAGLDAINGSGNTLVNKLVGNGAANRLDGGAGADLMTGGSGNDVYVVDDAADVLVEATGGGTDTVESSLSWTLGAEIENLTLTGLATINASGNGLANTLVGNAGNNSLDGGAGNDTMLGGAGNDTYVVNVATDVVTELASEGTDTIQSAVTWTLGSNVENLTLTGTGLINGTGNTLDNVLTGNGANNTLTGAAGNDTLDGGLGNDTMVGGAGNDTYTVNVTTDVVTELASEGTDTVLTSVTLAALAANVENLSLIGTSAINGTGNTLNNVLTGNSAVNTLDGGAGIDTMIGGAGNDTYAVDNSADVVTELANEGADLVQSTVTYSLSANVENLTLTGTGVINGTGNTLDNTLVGNGVNNNLTGGAGNDVLDGGLGNDTLVGGAGNDTYIVNVTTDVVTELASEGTDSIQSAVAWTLGSNVENLTLTGAGVINGTGNTLDNVLIGNSANNALTGAAGNDTLDGGLGNDTLVGGLGNDTYVVNVTTDVVTELASEGTDTIQSAVAWTLGSNVENLTLTGSGLINGSGNALDNVLIGNGANNTLTGAAGNDTLNGGFGNDTLVGGLGNDTYVVDVSTDVVTENASEGTDTVQSAVTWTLGTNLENLTLIGTGAASGTGNASANVLMGNSANNVLTGLAGADQLDGGAGNDTLNGGAAADVYQFARGYGQDTVQDNDAAVGVKDRIQFAAGIAQANLAYKQVGNNLEALINGTTDKIVVQDWYLGAQYHIEEFRFSDGSILSDAQVQGLVSAMAAFAAPAAVTLAADQTRMTFAPVNLGSGLAV